jgi:carbon-monoxide dehydrogenase iron sulfur subunit
MQEHIQVLHDKCRACRRCEMACIAAHYGITLKEALKRRNELPSRVHLIKTKTPALCHQCNPAPCCAICPTGSLRQKNGAIVVCEELCASCKLCEAVCPYGAIRMAKTPDRTQEAQSTRDLKSGRDVAFCCDMCRSWREENGKNITACVEACAEHALALVLSDGTVIKGPPKPVKEKETAAAQNQ